MFMRSFASEKYVFLTMNRIASSFVVLSFSRNSRFCKVFCNRNLDGDWPVNKIRKQLFHGHETLGVSDDTIYALSTAPGRGALAIIRVSGPQSTAIYKFLCPNKSLPEPRKVTLRKLFDPSDSNIVVDSAAVILRYVAPKSATGEDLLEFHIHGGSATQKAVLGAISKVSSITALPIRYAEPGEFTKRAFLNHKLDLAQVEALSDELSAETEQQRRAAARGDARRLGITYDKWGEKLLHARGEIEALIDFSEDQHFEDSPEALLKNITKQVNSILRETERHKIASVRGELLKRGIKISLLGPPNAGKSSLMNKISGRDASIVSQEAGTTRDIVEISLDIEGYLCTFADTAGLRDELSTNNHNFSIGIVEQEGIRRAKKIASTSDIVIVLASFERENSTKELSINYDNESLSLAASASSALIVLNKCDLILPSNQIASLINEFKSRITAAFSPRIPPPISMISCDNLLNRHNINENENDNIEPLMSNLVKVISGITELPIDLRDLVAVTERQRLIIDSLSTHLEDFKKETDLVLAAEHLRLAASCLAKITGRDAASDVEDLLGVIFEKFCVGK